MGWTGEYTYGKTLSYAEEKARVIKHYTWTNEGVTVRPLHVSNLRPAWYVAVEVIAPADHDAHPYIAKIMADGRKRYVFAEVMLTRNTRGEWMRKEICEGAGPCESKAPAAILRLLSPLAAPLRADGYDRAASAADWRTRCTKHNTRPKLKVGMKIRLESPALFAWKGDKVGTYAREFTVVEGRSKSSFYFLADEMGKMRCRLSAAALQPGFEILPA